MRQGLVTLAEDSMIRHRHWGDIFASLAKLETGLHKVEADLGQMRADLETFRKSLDAPREEG